VVIIDSTGHVIYVNQAHNQILQYPENGVIGKHYRELLCSFEVERVHDIIKQTLLDRRSWTGMIEAKKADGESLMIMSHIASICDDQSELKYIFNVFEDYSAVIAHELALQTALEKAEYANRAKTQFLSSMSHELRTPLNSILGFAQLMRLSKLDDKQQTQLDYIYQSGKHLLDLINQLLEFSKIEAGALILNIAEVDVQEIVYQTVAMIDPMLAQNDLMFKPVEWSDFNIKIQTDKMALKQVLINFLTNAIKYNRTQGTIEIKGEFVVQQACPYYQIKVIDSGKGIPKDLHHQVFEPFNRLGHEGHHIEGTGIGLAICKTLIEELHGKIGFESVENEGSCFWLSLPVIYPCES
jgi:PAS domain S-box-containing protein